MTNHISISLKAAANYARLWVKGYKWGQASTAEELRAVYKLRYDVYLEAGYIKPNSEELWKDEYDENSVNFYIKDKEGIYVGAIRLTLGSGKGMPVESYFNLKKKIVGRDHVVEPTRLVIKKEMRGGKRYLMFALGSLIYQYSRKKGITHWYATLPPKLASSFTRFGVEFRKLEQDTPTAKHLEARKEIAGYFEQQKLQPYLLDLNDV